MRTPAQVSTDPGVSDSRTVEKDIQPRSSVVSRLLAKVSRINDDYVDYQMETGVWRKLAL